ncbi:MAG: hypothetical protein KIS76_19420 [Pyrinomonadaceae bacterium]|nr:hypothetical protein [Pyrinomonadaceae bacterium]
MKQNARIRAALANSPQRENIAAIIAETHKRAERMKNAAAGIRRVRIKDLVIDLYQIEPIGQNRLP